MYVRDAVEEYLQQLTADQLEVVRGTDLAIIQHVAEMTEWCLDYRLLPERETNGVLRGSWWWWLDEIALGEYPLSCCQTTCVMRPRSTAARAEPERGRLHGIDEDQPG